MQRRKTIVSIGKSYKSDFAPASNYPDKFNQQLTDGQMVPNIGAFYTDVRMVGYNRTVNFDIDLENDGKSIVALEARCLCIYQDGVAPCPEVVFSASDDGESFAELGRMEFEKGLDKSVSRACFELEEPKDYRFVRFTMSPRQGAHFFFVDELLVYADVPEKEKEDTVANAYGEENVDRSLWKKLSTGKAAKPFAGENVAATKKYSFENCIFDQRAPENSILLTDQAHVGGLFGQDVWVGFNGIGDKKAVIKLDLGEERSDIYALKLHVPDETLDVVHPDYIDCFGSLDGEEFIFLGRIYAPANDRYFAYSLLFSEYINIRYLKFEFSKGEGFYWLEEIEVWAGSDEEIQAELFPKVYYPKVTEELVWDSEEPDYNERKNLLLGLPQQIDSSYYIDKYARGGNETPAETTVLTDGKKAASPDDCFYNHGGESLDFFYDLGKLSKIEDLRVYCYENNEKSLPRPDHIHVLLSEDATNWFKVGAFDRPWHRVDQIKKNKEMVFEGAERLEFTFPLETPYAARFVRFRIELENGLLLDELEAFGCKNISGVKKISESGLPSAPFFTNPDDEYFSSVENNPVKAKDIALIYHNNSNGDTLLPFVAYLDEEGNIKDTFMDGYLFLPASPLPTGGVAHDKSYMADWEFVCDNAMEASGGMDRLEKVVEEVKLALNKPDYKVQVYYTIPTMIDTIEDFGDVDGDGISEGLTNPQDRSKVFKWFIDMCMSKFKARNYKNLELGGFYWMNELVAWLKDDSHIIKEAADHVHAAGSYFLWIPYYVAHRYFLGYELGFDFVSMQPNYVFDNRAPFYKIPSCAQYTKQRGYTVELEHSYQALGDPIFARKYMLYLYHGAVTGYMNAIHAYYDDRDNIGLMGLSKEPLCRMQYDATYKFSKGTLEVTPEPKATLKISAEQNKIVRSSLNPENGLSFFTLVSSPQNGSVSLSDNGDFAYYPAKGFKGVDRFSYTYNNFLGESEECFVEIEVK